MCHWCGCIPGSHSLSGGRSQGEWTSATTLTSSSPALLSGPQAVEQFSQCQGGGGGASSKEWEDQDDSDSDAFDHHSGLLSQAVREHMYSSINT